MQGRFSQPWFLKIIIVTIFMSTFVYFYLNIYIPNRNSCDFETLH